MYRDIETTARSPFSRPPFSAIFHPLPRAPPKSAGLRELIYEPGFDDLPMDPAELFPAGRLRRETSACAQSNAQPTGQEGWSLSGDAPHGARPSLTVEFRLDPLSRR